MAGKVPGTAVRRTFLGQDGGWRGKCQALKKVPGTWGSGLNVLIDQDRIPIRVNRHEVARPGRRLVSLIIALVDAASGEVLATAAFSNDPAQAAPEGNETPAP